MTVGDLKKEINKYNDNSEVKIAIKRSLFSIDTVEKYVDIDTNKIECVIFKKENNDEDSRTSH